VKIYSEHSACPKCGAANASTQYVALCSPNTYVCPCRTSEEHLCRTCPRCGYSWPESPLEPSKQTEPPRNVPIEGCSVCGKATHGLSSEASYRLCHAHYIEWMESTIGPLDAFIAAERAKLTFSQESKTCQQPRPIQVGDEVIVGDYTGIVRRVFGGWLYLEGKKHSVAYDNCRLLRTAEQIEAEKQKPCHWCSGEKHITCCPPQCADKSCPVFPGGCADCPIDRYWFDMPCPICSSKPTETICEDESGCSAGAGVTR